MKQKVSSGLDLISEGLAKRKGLLPMLGMLFVLINLALQFIPGAGWVAQSDLFLHLGVLLGLLGMLLAWAL
jgi:hypothetical protein